jgi:hypothetical protein
VARIYGGDLNSNEDAMTPDDHNTVPQDVPRPDDYAYHMERVMSGLKFRISPENAEFLINLLSESRDDPDRCGECGIDSQQAGIRSPAGKASGNRRARSPLTRTKSLN